MVISIRRASQSAGMSSCTAAVTKTCSAIGRDLGQRLAPRGVQFGEHIVEQQHRIATFRPQQLVGGQPQRQRHRPRFAVARKAFRNLIAEPQLEVVAVRTDQADPAFEFGVAPARQRVEQRGLEQLRGARFRGRLDLDTSTPLRYWIAAGRDAGASNW